MDIRGIRYLSSRFRRGMEIAHEKSLFKQRPFLCFPNGCCGDASDLLAQYLMDNITEQNIKLKYVCGTYEYDDFESIYSHAWLVINDSYIVDITADQKQFKNERIFPQDAIQPCYVGENSEFHSLFAIMQSQCRGFYGLQDLGEYSYKRLNALYEIILDCIDEGDESR